VLTEARFTTSSVCSLTFIRHSTRLCWWTLSAAWMASQALIRTIREVARVARVVWRNSARAKVSSELWHVSSALAALFSTPPVVSLVEMV